MKPLSLLIFTYCLLASVCTFASEKVTRERVYVQTDKQLYLAGELLWIKLITTDEKGAPSILSKVAYVELLDDAGAQLQVKIEVINGVGEGCLELPPSLVSGNYRMVAYTRYMRNEGEDVYFSKIIPILNTFTLSQKINLISDSDSPLIIIEELEKRENDSHYIENDITINVKTDRQSYPIRSMGDVELSNLPVDVSTLSISLFGNDLSLPQLSFGLTEWKQEQLGTSESNSPFSVTLVPEYEGHIVTGTIVDLPTEKPVSDRYVNAFLSFPSDQIRLFSGQQAGGNIEFYTKRVSGMHEISTSVSSTSLGRCRVDIKSPFATHSISSLPELKVNTHISDKLTQRSIGVQALNAYVADSLSKFVSQNPLFEWPVYEKYILDEYTRFETMREVVTEFVTPLRFRRVSGNYILSVMAEEGYSFSPVGALVLLDGVPIFNHNDINNYDPLLVKEIDVYTGKYQFGGQVFDGIAFFKTYGGSYQGLVIDESTQIFRYEGTQAHRHFFIPSYATEEEKKSRIPDFRHTLLWNPHVETHGKTSVTIPFTTSDLTGDFVVVVEGITKDGKVVSGTAQLKVE